MKLVAENITITHDTIARAVAVRDAAPIAAVAREAVLARAAAIDVNLGPPRKGLGDALEFVLDVLEGEWKGEIWLDGSDAALMARGAARWPHAVTLNGYAGGEGREQVLELAASEGLDLVVFLMTPQGIPRSADERLGLCAELVGRAAEAGLGPERLIIDPVLAPMGWMDGQELNAGLFTVLRALPELFGPDIRSVVGLSNLVTGATGAARVKWLEECFLAKADGAGLTHAMVDVTRAGIVATAQALNVFDNGSPFAPADFDR